MSPLIRGRIIPETESAGPAKRTLDVLLWVGELTYDNLNTLDRIEILREYLLDINPPHCSVQFHVPDSLVGTTVALKLHGIKFSETAVLNEGTPNVNTVIANLPQDLQPVAITALGCDADIVLINEFSWFPYVQEFDDLGILLTSAEILEMQCEIFVRGHDIPWAFGYIAWGLPWTPFYQMGESRLFAVGIRFLDKAHKAMLDQKTQDDARMLIYNRLANLCFTRDRLLFIEIQQAAAKRAKWTRQQFTFEAAYYLNFYYLLIFGGFDHLAVVVNGALHLGLRERDVAAMSPRFLEALQAKDPGIHAIFTHPDTVEFMKRIASLRHFAAHRGSIMPAEIYETPDQEPTAEELDADIEQSGEGVTLNLYPAGKVREYFRENLRFKARLKRYKRVAEGMVKIEIDGNYFLIRPMSDIGWNFDRFHAFLEKVLNACATRI
jgi:hypothetical protein